MRTVGKRHSKGSRLVLAFFSAVIVLSMMPLPAGAAFYYCDGTGNITRNGATNENTIVRVATYTINSGVTVTTSTQKGIVICATVSITIHGTLTVDGLGQAGGAPGSSGTAGYAPGGAAGSVGSSCTGTGGARAPTSTAGRVLHAMGAPEAELTGSGGGGGANGNLVDGAGCGGGGGGGFFPGGNAGSPATTVGGVGTGGTGGAGGGFIILVAPNVTISGTGIVSANGANGGNGTGDSRAGGGGGGAGGLIYVLAQSYVNNGVARATGGNGGTGSLGNNAGGAGGVVFSSGSAGSNSQSGGTGGGGGAGGAAIVRDAAGEGEGADGRNAGIAYAYDTTTTATDPGIGKLQFDSTTFASVTELYISETDGDSNGIAAHIAAWDDSTTSGNRGTLIIYKDASPANLLVYSVSGASVDNGAWVTVQLTHVASSGVFADLDNVKLFFSRTGDQGAQGDTGATGPQGPAGPEGPAGEGNVTKVTSALFEFTGMTLGETSILLFFFANLLLAFGFRLLFVTITSIMGIVEELLVGEAVGFIATVLFLVLAWALEIFRDVKSEAADSAGESVP